MRVRKRTRNIIAVAVIIFASAMVAWYYLSLRPAPADDLAKCLRDKGVIFYGANDCRDCADQNMLFGRSFRFVPYVNCTKQPQRCAKAAVKNYPTWEFPGGRRVEAQMELPVLARQTRCPVPEEQ